MGKKEFATKALQVKQEISELFEQGSSALEGWFNEVMNEHFGGCEVYSKKYRKNCRLFIENGIITVAFPVKKGKGGSSYTGTGYETFYDGRNWLLYDWNKDRLDALEENIVHYFNPKKDE